MAFLGSVLLALLWPNAYESSVRLHVQPLPPPPNQQGGLYYPPEYYRQLIAQYNIEDFDEIVQGMAFAGSIAAILEERYGLSLTPKLIAESLRTDRQQRLLELTFTSAEPLVAQAMADAAETIFETRAGELSATVRQGIVSVQVVDPASEPEATPLARLGLDVIARTVVAFLLVTGFAFLLEVMSGLCRAREDLEETLRLPVLIAIPPIPVADAGPGPAAADET